MAWVNWAGDQCCTPSRIIVPGSVGEICEVVRTAAATGRTVRVTGAGHSFGDLVLTDDTLLVLDKISGVRALDLGNDQGHDTVTVGAGTRLAELNVALDALGLALPNLGDIDSQSVAGALATGTHGTGARLGNLSTLVEALEIVTADGQVVRYAADATTDHAAERLSAARISLGALGVVVAVTLRVVPAFTLRARDRAYPLADTLARLDELVEGNDHFEFYVFPHSDRALTRRNNRTAAPAVPRGALAGWVDAELVPNHLLGAVCRLGRALPATVPVLNRAVAAAFPPSTRTDVSHRVFTSRRRVRFTEMEWAVPRAACPSVLAGIREAGRRHVVNFPVEVRFVAGDTASMLSPSWARDSAYLAVHAFQGMAWEPYFREVQAVALAHDGRPHWGKRHFLDAERRAPRYPAWERFQAVRSALDPGGVFANAHVRRVLGDTAR